LYVINPANEQSLSPLLNRKTEKTLGIQGY